ncbi:hypothetical protein BD780_003507 [Clostridium tetanomorphum]|nr:hypothetical protein [Clostridium tetanomorphum]NRS86282.1 hypothetical protein [Clostridium tetanomorphum]
MDKKRAEILMGKGFESSGGFRWSLFVLYIVIEIRFKD